MNLPPTGLLLGLKASDGSHPAATNLTRDFSRFSELLRSSTFRPIGGSSGDGPELPPVPIWDDRRGLEPGSSELVPGPGQAAKDLAGSDEDKFFESSSVDPLQLHLSIPVGGAPSPATESPSQRGAAWVDLLAAELVRAVAWGGDRRRGAARLELGGSRFGGTCVVVQADGREVTLELEAPPHVDAAELGARLRERLERRGLIVHSISER